MCSVLVSRRGRLRRSPCVKGQADDERAIVANMDYLTPLIGTWNAIAEFHHRDGTTTDEVGTYKVSWVLGRTYMQW
jgi:hypothetical protein